MIYKDINEFTNAINEGLIHTHDINTSISILKKWYTSMTNYCDIQLLDNDTFEIVIKDKISTSLFSTLIRDINNLGYFPSIVYLMNEKNMENRFNYDFNIINNILMSLNIITMKMTCEKKFDDDVKIFKIIYHICKEQNLLKILENGLSPRSKNRIGSHPDRVYFCLDINSCDNLINRFKINDNFKNLPEQIYKILEINIPKLNKDYHEKNKKIIFRKDPNIIDGIYTYDNIPKKYISIKK